MKNLKTYCRLSRIGEVDGFLGKKNTLIIAGGTLAYKAWPPQTECLVDIKHCGLGGIRKEKGNLLIGACATFDEIDKSPLCRREFSGVLSKAASLCSSQLIRNMTTIGGNIARPHAFNIFPVLLSALDARVELYAGGKRKTVPVEEICRPQSPHAPGKKSLITEIAVPLKKYAGVDCVKFAKTRSSWESYLNAAFAVSAKKGKISDAGICFGAAFPFPLRLEKIENWLLGRKIRDLDINFILNFAARVMTTEIKISEYRRELALVFLKRFLREVSYGKDGK